MRGAGRVLISALSLAARSSPPKCLHVKIGVPARKGTMSDRASLAGQFGEGHVARRLHAQQRGEHPVDRVAQHRYVCQHAPAVTDRRPRGHHLVAEPGGVDDQVGRLKTSFEKVQLVESIIVPEGHQPL